MNKNIGIGFRKDFAEEFLSSDILHPAFVELAPENWMGIGGYWKKIIQQVAEKYPITSHGLSLSIENVSYYTPVAAEMSELEFINAIVKEADCNLLLDVNNVYVNAFNHQYNAKEFIKGLPLDKVSYIHMAGHEQVEPDLIIDTHGQDIILPVYDLFDYTTQRVQPVFVLLERDFNIPALAHLQSEMDKLVEITNNHWKIDYANSKRHIPAAV